MAFVHYGFFPVCLIAVLFFILSLTVCLEKVRKSASLRPKFWFCDDDGFREGFSLAFETIFIQREAHLWP